MKKLIALLPLVALLFLFSCSGEEKKSEKKSEAPVATTSNFEFIVLQMNDVYEIGPLEDGKVGGMARVAQIRQDLLKENPNVVTILSGDFISPSLIGTLEYEGEKIAGKQMIDALNCAGLDYVTFGNHEFDVKENELLQCIDRSEFIWTSANALHRLDSVTTEPFMQKGQPVPEYVIHNLIAGTDTVKLGFIGVVLPFNQQAYVAYEDVETELRNTYESIKNQCDVVMGITHLEMEEDKVMAGKMPEMPLLLGGHDHSNMTATIGPTTITKADANAKTVYIHRVSINTETKAVTIDSELKDVDESVAFEAATNEVVNKWLDISDKAMIEMGYTPDEVLMTTTEPLDGRESTLRYKPSNLGILIAEAMLITAEGYDMAFYNSGSVRLDDQLTGAVTQYDVLRTLPFGGACALTEMKGSDLKEVLEIGTVTNVSLGGYFQLAGATRENDVWQINGAPLDEAKTYKIVSTDFLMAGLEANLAMLKNFPSDVPATLPNGVKNDIRDVVIAHMKALGAAQ
jgi:2',3'-cyclic-nucleotide 2'-phosphodiesterase (5'-nucleotidase family)